MKKINSKRTSFGLSITLIVFLYLTTPAFSQPVVFNVDAGKPKADIASTMWGVFFEDINFAADGGLYAELVKNRSFEFASPLMGWKEQKSSKYSMNKESGYTTIINRNETNNANPRYARITLNAEQGYGLTNEGFRGMGIQKDMLYNFAILASEHDRSDIKIKLELTDKDGNVLGGTSVDFEGKDWKKYTASFKATRTEQEAQLNIWFTGKGIVDIDMVSLFPANTWKNRPGGLRADLVQLLADMKPGFIRFPGGCIVEGRELATRYQWKKTTGKPEDRTLIVNRWNTEFAHRPAPDYFQSFGIGFFEYFQLAEDIGAEPLPIISCGMACQFNTAELVPMDQLDPYIQDALDLIEFANGSSETAWGKVRIAMGHAEPFNLKMIGVGNEQWGPQYIERYEAFVKAIKAKYPAVRIVTGDGPFPTGELFDYADKTLRKLDAEIIDEHYYQTPEWFLKNATRYDNYDRKGAKVFAGEYAAHLSADIIGEKRNTWECALAEAAFMTGLERNADVVNLCSYAPLFAHLKAWQWAPDLIWFDNLKSYGTPDYYVQKLFSLNKGTQVLPMTIGKAPVTGQQGFYASAVLDQKTHEVIVKIVNTSATAQSSTVAIDGVKKLSSSGRITILKSDKLTDLNTIDNPVGISPTEQAIIVKGKKVDLALPPYSFAVVRLKSL